MRVPIHREYAEVGTAQTVADAGGYTSAAPVMPMTTDEYGAGLKMPYINPASGTFAADLVTALVNAGLMEGAP